LSEHSDISAAIDRVIATGEPGTIKVPSDELVATAHRLIQDTCLSAGVDPLDVTVEVNGELPVAMVAGEIFSITRPRLKNAETFVIGQPFHEGTTDPVTRIVESDAAYAVYSASGRITHIFNRPGYLAPVRRA
jgi:hypothetical protein